MSASPYQSGDLIITKDVVYQVEKQLGEGGAGSAYKAINKSLNAPCVVKIMHASAAADPAACERFDREAIISAKIGSHPNLVTVIHKGHLPDGRGPKGTPYHTMEWAHGLSVRKVCQSLPKHDRRFPLATAIKIAADVLQGLAFMHLRGVIHRDIKPDNVLFVERPTGETLARIIDLDAACLLEDPEQPSYIFTPRYAAPEQFAPGLLGPKVDVFATAVMLFEMLAGRHPYDEFGRSYREQARRIHRAAPLLSDFGTFPEELSLALVDALAVEPDQRSTVQAFLRTLENVGNSLVADGDGFFTEPDLLPPPSERPLPIRRADLLAGTEPGPPPDMEEFATTSPGVPLVARTQPLGPSFAHIVVQRPPPAWQPPAPSRHEASTIETPPTSVRRPRSSLLDQTTSLDLSEFFAERKPAPSTPRAEEEPLELPLRASATRWLAWLVLFVSAALFFYVAARRWL